MAVFCMTTSLNNLELFADLMAKSTINEVLMSFEVSTRGTTLSSSRNIIIASSRTGAGLIDSDSGYNDGAASSVSSSSR